MSFEVNKARYIDTLHQNHYIFEITKTCGYSEWAVLHKRATLKELFCYVRRVMEAPIIELFVKDNFGNKFILTESDYVLYNLIVTNYSFFTPVYPLPSPVVYTIFLDDGHNHVH
jgi:hypothetical protein